jgi:hypothetical protein
MSGAFPVPANRRISCDEVRVEGLLALIGAFPTAVFAALAVVCLSYWLLVLVGAADIDLGGGGADQAIDAVTGAAKGIVGASKGAGLVGEALAALGLSRVPLTITLTTFSLTGFFVSAATLAVLHGVLPSSVAALVAAVAAVGGGLGAASLSSRAVARLFVEGPVEAGGASLVGKTCRVTITADEAGGQARADEVIVRVRAVGRSIAAGEEAVIVERGDDGVFVVEPLRDHLPNEQDAFAQLEASSAAAPVPTGASAPVVVATGPFAGTRPTAVGAGTAFSQTDPDVTRKDTSK